MESNQLKQAIKAKAQAIGIDKIGFTDAAPFLSIEAKYQEQIDRGYSTGFEHPILEERIYPDRIFDKPRSIIAICLAYPSAVPVIEEERKGPRRGLFARASWGIDYHTILRDKMSQLIAYLEELVPDARFKSMVDTGELSDVAVAERAGIGFVGRNTLLITPEFGSYVYLGEIVTDLVIEPDDPIPNGCGDCYRCIKACPTQALLGEGQINGRRCLSYQTQTKDLMPLEFRRKMTHVIYGCDICQMACPYNRGVDSHLHPEMEPDAEVVRPVLQDLLFLTNKEFKAKYGHLSGAWRGKKPIQRNAIIALANYRDRSSMPLLMRVLEEDPRPVIRATAAYALSLIEGQQNPVLLQLIEDQRAKEDQPAIIDEMTQAIQRLQDKRPAR